MRRSMLTMQALTLVLALAFAAQAARAAQASGELTVVGRLTPTVEAGGWLVVADYGKYLITNAGQFRREPWFRAGASVEAKGRVREDVMSIHMEGVPFQVRTMRARAGSTAAAAPQEGAGAEPPASAQQQQQQMRTPTRVIVSGESVVQAQPDTAVLTLAVITQNASASEAQAENASRTEAVLRAARAAAGAGAEVKTSGYSLQPQYAYKEGAPPTITGYIARNAVNVTTGELTRVGAVIDAASRAGANSVDGLAFTLRRDERARNEALSSAVTQARSKAQVIAGTLGGRLVRIVEVQEAGTVRPVPVYERAAGEFGMAKQAATPVEPGSLEIRAQVQLVAEIETKE